MLQRIGGQLERLGRPMLKCRRRFSSKSTALEGNRQALDVLEECLRDSAMKTKLSQRLAPETTQELLRVVQQLQLETNAGASTLTKAGVATATSNVPAASVSWKQLCDVSIQYGVPFIGFGFADNFLMILAGDYIDLTLGISFGISSMAAAGIGNTFSDAIGISLGRVIEDFSARLGIPKPKLTPQQRNLRQTRIAKLFGCNVGIIIGCLVGMVPLLFMETKESLVAGTQGPQQVKSNASGQMTTTDGKSS